MCSDIAIKVSDLSKCYHIYKQPRDRAKQLFYPTLQRVAGKPVQRYYNEFWALKDVSFEIRKGETVGVIGRNGSGKSTLLQLICGTLEPTQGSVETHGRIAALLELGSGFSPEFTGRENIYMNGAILGMGQKEIESRFDEIVAFSEIADFIDRPVKTYSSGMMVRLAFSVAIHVNPEILIVDEALSVGDEVFQRKCFSRIEAIRETGATILFVSHSGGQITDLCNRAILLDAGEQLAFGAPKHIVGRYQKLAYAPVAARKLIREQIRGSGAPLAEHGTAVVPVPEDAIPAEHLEKEGFDPHLKPSSTVDYESHGARIEAPAVRTQAGAQVNNLVRGGTYRYTYTVRFAENARNVRFGMLIKTVAGVELGGAVSAASGTDGIPYVAAGSTCRVEFRFCAMLNPGMYFLNAGVLGNVGGGETFLHRMTDAAVFRIMPDADSLATGPIDFSCYPEVELEETNAEGTDGTRA